MSGRPLVVLGGWLGAKANQLKRYEQLYQTLGFDVISFLPDPCLVVGSALSTHSINPISSSDWPKDGDPKNKKKWHMHQLAWHVLGRINTKQNGFFLFHAFSNGGCFLWESMRRILDSIPHQPQPIQDILQTLLKRLKGVIFDSSPAWFGTDSKSSLRSAVQHCSRAEKLAICKQFGPGTVYYDGKNETYCQRRRCNNFFQYLRNDNLDIPQLYLVSKDDPLCDFKRVNELVHHRRCRKFQKSYIFYKVWDKSIHCAHLKLHPLEYREAVETFTELALLRSKL